MATQSRGDAGTGLLEGVITWSPVVANIALPGPIDSGGVISRGCYGPDDGPGMGIPFTCAEFETVFVVTMKGTFTLWTHPPVHRCGAMLAMESSCSAWETTFDGMGTGPRSAKIPSATRARRLTACVSQCCTLLLTSAAVVALPVRRVSRPIPRTVV